MKYKILIFLFLSNGIFYACDNIKNDTFVESVASGQCTELDSEIEVRKSENQLLAPYVKIVDNRFVLDISEEDAVKLGVSKESYRLACEDIVRENANIEKMEREGANFTLPVLEGAETQSE